MLASIALLAVSVVSFANAQAACKPDSLVDDFAANRMVTLLPIDGGDQRPGNLMGGDYGAVGATFVVDTTAKEVVLTSTNGTSNFWFAKFDIGACFDLTGYYAIAFDIRSANCSVRLVDSDYLPLSKYITPDGTKKTVIQPLTDFAKNIEGGPFDFVHLKDWTMVDMKPQGAVFRLSNLRLIGGCSPTATAGAAAASSSAAAAAAKASSTAPAAASGAAASPTAAANAKSSANGADESLLLGSAIAGIERSRLASLKFQLSEALGKTLMPKGVSSKYITSNVIAGQADVFLARQGTAMPAYKSSKATDDLRSKVAAHRGDKPAKPDADSDNSDQDGDAGDGSDNGDGNGQVEAKEQIKRKREAKQARKDATPRGLKRKAERDAERQAEGDEDDEDDDGDGGFAYE
ncbi:hypothetical protein BC831DRAFT_506637 [Entophlyctis helioformis]|nr:hypothetical protein BC831DRAFT_506637 [Entophlyctis helioformis]